MHRLLAKWKHESPKSIGGDGRDLAWKFCSKREGSPVHFLPWGPLESHTLTLVSPPSRWCCPISRWLPTLQWVSAPHSPGPSRPPSGPHLQLCNFVLPTGPSCLDMEVSASTVTEEGALCAGWLSQPAPATLQPLAPWTPYTEYVPHEAVSCPYSADMYVQPMCPSYTVVGPSSVLTYASQPLITNVTVCHAKALLHPGHPLRKPSAFYSASLEAAWSRNSGICNR